MKKTLICFVVLLSYAIAVMECGAFGIGNQNVFRVPGKTCVPLSAADLAVSPPDSAPLLPKDIMGKVTISLSSDVKGRLRLNHRRIEKEGLQVFFEKSASLDDEEGLDPDCIRANSPRDIF